MKYDNNIIREFENMIFGNGEKIKQFLILLQEYIDNTEGIPDQVRIEYGDEAANEMNERLDMAEEIIELLKD